jgi:hypothetical protein
MIKHVVLLGALLLAAPVFSQQENLLEFQLTENSDSVLKKLGKPTMVSQTGDLEAWQYQIGLEDNHEYSHILLFRISSGQLVSLTRNWEQERTVDELFQYAESKVYYYPDADRREYAVRVQRLSGGRVLLAMGASKDGDPTAQVVLIRESELQQFHPWLRLEPAKTTAHSTR